MDERLKKEIDMAYAAGILDGDGSFSILKNKGKYYPCIQLSNAFKGMSEWLHEKFGGSLRIKKPQQPHHKILYVWSARGVESCLKIIERILPHIVLKTEQCYVMENFLYAKMKDISEREGEIFSLRMKNINRELLMKWDTLSPQALEDSKSETFWSYIAGIIDTEGSFCIKKEKPHSGSISIRYNPIIQLTMVPAHVLNHLRRKCSLGSYCIPKADCTTKGYAYKFSICSKDDSIKFISYLMPYLRFKKEQASLLVKFCENFGNTKHRQSGVSEELLTFREECYQQMRCLNK